MEYWPVKNNRNKATPTKGEMTRHIKQHQAKIDANMKRLAYLPDENESDNNSVEPPKSIKGRKAKKKVPK